MRPISELELKVNVGEFGLRLRELRIAKGLTQAELAERLEVSPATVGNYEQGTRRPTFPEDVVKIAAVLGVDVGELFVMPKTKPSKSQHRGPGRPKKSDDEK